jgi:hypothetical protein
MQKRITAEMTEHACSEPQWLNLELVADVEVTSEDSAHPIESAFSPHHAEGWRAGTLGDQTIRLLFKRPQRLTRIRLHFVETDLRRTHEYVLRWSSDHGRVFRDIVRQQWNFSPPDSINETEDHAVDLHGVTTLELAIRPDISGGAARASLCQMRLA